MVSGLSNSPNTDEITLLATKLLVPQPRSNIVHRPRLVERLTRAVQLGHKLTAILAPPGSGKTTLVSEWLANLQLEEETPNIAWLSLDKGDNEPGRFLAYALAALQSIEPELGAGLWADQTITTKDLVTTLINEIAALPQRLLLVLDDYHVIEFDEIHYSISYLLDNLPARVHMIIASRAALPFSLARLRAHGAITEIGAADLRFTPIETALFLRNTMDLNLREREIALLAEKTEGWIAGLQMIALSLQGRPNISAESLTGTVTGGNRYIFDYLMEEVLQQQPPYVQQFLLCTAILDRLCGPLCDALVSPVASQTSTPQPPAQETLRYLERANLFIIPLDSKRYWYRYHNLFADLLRYRLARDFDESDLTLLHQRASDWFEQQGLYADAMRHALAGVDAERIIRLAKQLAAPMLSRGESITLLSWLATLPDYLVQSRPGISLLRAWAMVLTGELETAEEHLQDATKAIELHPIEVSETKLRGEIEALRAAIAYFRRDMSTAIRLLQRALEFIPADDRFLRGCVAQSLGAAYSWQGRVVEATRAFAEASIINRRTGNLQVSLIAQWNLGRLQQAQAHLHQAEEIYRQGIATINQQPQEQQQELLAESGRLHIGLADILYEWNELDAAREQVTTALELSQSHQQSSAQVMGHLMLARIRMQRGDIDAAGQALQQADYLAQRVSGPFFWSAWTAIWQVRFWLYQGNLRAVADWLQVRGLPPDNLPETIPYLQEDEYLVVVRLLLAQSRQPTDLVPLRLEKPFALAAALLQKIERGARDTHRTGRLLEVLLLQALVQQQIGNVSQAVDRLSEALAIGEPEGYVRTFCDEGKPVVALMHQVAGRKFSSEYIAKLLAALGSSRREMPAGLLLDPLSERELEILRLIATGVSNKDLATQLVLTVGTIKWHLNNIYSKLGVRSRTQAVAKARDLGLI